MGVDSRTILARRSPRRILLVLGLLSLALGLGIGLRIWGLRIWVIGDESLSPSFQKGDWLLAYPVHNVDNSSIGSFQVLELPTGEILLRQVAGLSGDTLKIKRGGGIEVRGKKLPAKRVGPRKDPWWIEEAELVVPSLGDTLIISQQKSAAFDFALQLLSRQSKAAITVSNRFLIDTVLLPESSVGRVQIRGKPMSAELLQGLDWNELELIRGLLGAQMGADHLTLRRTLSDSSKALDTVVVAEDMLYISCLKADRCRDSREEGWIPVSAVRAKPWFHFRGLRLLRGSDS